MTNGEEMIQVLTDAEIALVAGGVDSVGKTIYVTGTRQAITIESDGGGSSSHLEGSGMEPHPTIGGSGGGPIEYMEPAKETPCVTAAPAGFSLAEINNVALALSETIAKGNDDEWEYGAIIYAVDGRIGFTSVVTQQNPDNVIYPLGEVPDNAVILAVVHNHPDVHTINDTYPSEPDWENYDRLVNPPRPLPGGITADRNMLMYVYTNQDWKTRVYDKDDRSTTQPSCSLQ